MLVNCGYVNGRDILYCDLENDFTKIDEFPTKNWLLFAIADKAQVELLYSFAEKCLDKNVLYICGAGEACAEIDNAFDLVIVDRKVASLNRDLTQNDFEDSPMTIWNDDFDEGFWFCLTTASHEKEMIEKVLVANITDKSYEDRIKALAIKIKSGWFAPY